MVQGTRMTANQNIMPWWESLEQYCEQLVRRLGVTLQDIVQVLSFLGIGFLVGFLLKKYMRYFFVITLTMILFFIVFDHFGIILIDWSHVQQLTGIDPTNTIQQFGERLLALIKENIVLTISGFAGFIIGYRVG